MMRTAIPEFLDQPIGKLVYAIIPLNIFLTIAHIAASWEAHNQSLLGLCIAALVVLVVFWGISTVRLIARRHRRNRWRLIALTPPTIVLVTHSYEVNASIGFVAATFLIWLLAASSLAFLPGAAPKTAVHSQ